MKNEEARTLKQLASRIISAHLQEYYSSGTMLDAGLLSGTERKYDNVMGYGTCYYQEQNKLGTVVHVQQERLHLQTGETQFNNLENPHCNTVGCSTALLRTEYHIVSHYTYRYVHIYNAPRGYVPHHLVGEEVIVHYFTCRMNFLFPGTIFPKFEMIGGGLFSQE